MRINSLFKNLISEVLPQALILIMGIVKSKVFLDYLGEDTVGLSQLFAQIMAYVSLVEGGLGRAVIYRLYKPVVEQNWTQISKIKNGTRSIFRIIIIIMLPISLIGGIIMPNLIKDNTFSLGYIVFNFILYVLSEIILYTTVFERSLYVATERTYKSNIIIKASLIIKKILEIVLAIAFKNLTIIFISFIIMSILENMLIRILAKKDFNSIEKNISEKDTSILQDIKDLIVHKVAGLCSSNIDIILISNYIGLGKVVVYSTYAMFVNSIISVLNKISNAFLGTVGNIIEEAKEKSYETFKEYNSFIFFIAMLITAPFCYIINYFIDIFYTGKIETTISIAILFTIILLYNLIRLPLVTYTEGAGLFKETKICPIIESITNLVLSLILVQYLGIIGCLIATIISFIVSEYIIKPKIIYEKVFDKKCAEYYKMNLKYIIIIFMQIVASIILQLNIDISNYLELFKYFIVFCLINLILTMLIFKFVLKQDFLEKRLKQLLSKSVNN